MSPFRVKRILASVGGLAVALSGLMAVAQDVPQLAGVPDRIPDSSAIRSPGEMSVPAEPAAANAPRLPRLPAPGTPALPGSTAAGRGSEPEMVTERYPDGNVKIERQVILDTAGNYVDHGTYTEYDSNGRIIRSGEFRNGKQHGKWLHYFDEGQGHLFSGKLENEFAGPFVAEAIFADGLLHGSWIIKSRNGRKIIDWNFDRGIRSGKSIWWYPNGEKRLEVVYRNGMMDGELLEWNPEGKLVSRVPFVDGRRLVKKVEWHGPGQKAYEGCYLVAQDVVEPSYDWWNATAKAIPIAHVGQDQKHGVWTAWYPNGNKQIEARYDRDLPVGMFTWWYENGQKQAEGDYKGGVKHGMWTTWHPSGFKESKCEYRDGILVGKWMRWDTAGKLAEIHDFDVESLEDVKKARAGLGDKDTPNAPRPMKTNAAPKAKST